MKIKVKVNKATYEVEVGDINDRPIKASLEGESYEIWPEETTVETPAPLASKPMETPRPVTTAVRSVQPAPPPSGDSSKTILAPIPGVIISVNVKVGDNVSVGQEVCVLEAMKMKNSIKTTRSGKISSMSINPGDHVQHGQVLLVFAD